MLKALRKQNILRKSPCIGGVRSLSSAHSPFLTQQQFHKLKAKPRSFATTTIQTPSAADSSSTTKHHKHSSSYKFFRSKLLSIVFSAPFILTMFNFAVCATLLLAFMFFTDTDEYIAEQQRLEEEFEHQRRGLTYEEVESMQRHPETNYSLLRRIYEKIRKVLRALRLFLQFIPVVVTLPVFYYLLFPYMHLWYNLLVFTLQTSGACFIKFGQWIGTRPDLFPEDLCAEMGKLQSNAPAHSYRHTARIIRESFGKPVEQIFEHFDPNPIASGSIAQIHKAVYQGKVVAVKIVHPKVERDIIRDLRIMQLMARLVSKVIRYDLEESVVEFSGTMRAQVDMAIEGKNLKRFVTNFKAYPNIIFPEPLLSSRKVLVETFEEGTSITKFVNEAKLSTKQKKFLASVGVTLYLKMMLLDNFIHSDLHPGNIYARINKHGKPEIIVLDAGLITVLSKRERQNFIDLFTAVVMRDGDKAATLMIERSQKGGKPVPVSEEDKAGFRTEMVPLINQVLEKPLTEIEVGKVLQTVLNLGRKYHVAIDSKFTTLVLGTIVLEGLGKQLDPELNFIDAAKPILLNEPKLVAAYLRRVMFEKMETFTLKP